MSDDQIIASGKSPQWAQFLNFKTRRQYLDLPDENYKRSLTIQVLEAVNKLTTTISAFALVWFVMLVSRLYLGLFFYASLLLGLLLILAGLFWQVIQSKLGIESMIAIFVSLVIGLSFWLVQIS
jgi:hypothetical protein